LKDQLLKSTRTEGSKDAVPPIEMVNSVDELLKKCDAVMIFSMDGRLHLKQAERCSRR